MIIPAAIYLLPNQTISFVSQQDILQDVDAVLYVDVDTLFLGPVYDVWKHFDLMNSTQMVALVNETDELRTGWYSRFARHPFYGATG